MVAEHLAPGDRGSEERFKNLSFHIVHDTLEGSPGAPEFVILVSEVLPLFKHRKRRKFALNDKTLVVSAVWEMSTGTVDHDPTWPDASTRLVLQELAQDGLCVLVPARPDAEYVPDYDHGSSAC
jgi:hypothetical protein